MSNMSELVTVEHGRAVPPVPQIQLEMPEPSSFNIFKTMMKKHLYVARKRRRLLTSLWPAVMYCLVSIFLFHVFANIDAGDVRALALALTVPLYMVLSVQAALQNAIVELVTEKESKMKIVQEIYGLTPVMYFISWAGYFCIVALVCVTVIYFLLGIIEPVMSKSNPVFVIVLLLAAYIQQLEFAVIVSVLLNRVQTASAFSGFINLVFLLIAEAMQGWLRGLPKLLWYVASLLPTVNLFNGFAVLLYSEALYYCDASGCYQGISSKTAFVSEFCIAPYDEEHPCVKEFPVFSAGESFIMILFNIILYGFIAWWFEQVWQGDFGQAKPCLFCIDPAYMCPRRSRARELNLSLVQEDARSSAMSLRNLRKVFKGGKVAVDGIDLEIQHGEIFALLGHNGAGKTTCINCVVGLIPITSGDATVNGHDVHTELEAVRRNISVCPQDNPLYDVFTVRQHLMFFASLRGVGEQMQGPKVIEVLTALGIPEKVDDLCTTLSGGQKRRLWVATALLGETPLVFLDEPTSGMDPSSRRQLWELHGRAGRAQTESTDRILAFTLPFEEVPKFGPMLMELDRSKQVRSAGAMDKTKNAMSWNLRFRKRGPEEQLEDLQRRFTLLEGERKATYETAKLNIQQNKESMGSALLGHGMNATHATCRSHSSMVFGWRACSGPEVVGNGRLAQEIITQMKEENKSLRNQIAVLRDEKPLSLEKTLEETMTVAPWYDLLKNESQKKREYLDQPWNVGRWESLIKVFTLILAVATVAVADGFGDRVIPMDDDDFPDDDLSETPEFPLPEGVSKEILTEAKTSEWKKPKMGDEVTVQYVGRLELAGEVHDLDSSDGTGGFTYTLGQGDLCKGLEHGLPTMRKGERAKFTMTAAFGPKDLAEKHADKADTADQLRVIYEVELISWKARTDLFADGSVIKTCVEEGSGWKMPRLKEEVCMSIQIASSDGSLKELTDVEYTLGTERSRSLFGSATAVLDACLVGMKKREVALLHCKELDYGEGARADVEVTLTLHELYETKDVSFEKNQSLMKKQIVEGQGYETPKDGSTVHLAVEAALNEKNEPFPGYQKKTLEFVCGDGQVADALEFAIMEMKKGEKAILHVKEPEEIARQLELEVNSEMYLTLVLEDFEALPALGLDEHAPKLERAQARKELGTKHFKSNRWALAVLRYKSVTDLLSYVDHFPEEPQGKAKELKLICELNKAACYLKLHLFPEAKTACKNVLQEQPGNVKALFRRAQAEMGLKNFSECIADCKKVLQLDQQNRDAKILLRQAIADQKEADKKSKAVFASMCKAFGKDSTNDVVPEQPRPQEKQMIQERSAAKQGILSTVIQGVSRAMFFFPNLVFSNFSYFFGYVWQRLSGKSTNGPKT
ncbi:Phospholipid-transporting ATPase ABCA1 (ATP-binding cassette sub-family A member 1) (ATP-binding cassette transporter 1) (ABC-1) (ATP-binding cassette 1) (Cholesterol efflux regulatory protein) [Durusdinium trenchii]|uniref:peptidylprolyl isomerase n=1 Tax=Durusdinium trenchii TaxID=1381693 RepID=A0ABP0KP29_9DINO